MSREGPLGQLVKNVTDEWGVKGGPFKLISKKQGPNNALIVRSLKS